ncbi:hypothetical protein [Deferrisoma sp.]
MRFVLVASCCALFALAASSWVGSRVSGRRRADEAVDPAACVSDAFRGTAGAFCDDSDRQKGVLAGDVETVVQYLTRRMRSAGLRVIA